MSVMNIKGLVSALKNHEKRSEKNFRSGLIQAGAFLQRESMKLVPIDTTALRASANTRWEGEGFDTGVIVSYGTEYAVYVHEMPENRHKPGKQAKYLEQPAREKRDRMGRIVAEWMGRAG